MAEKAERLAIEVQSKTVTYQELQASLIYKDKFEKLELQHSESQSNTQYIQMQLMNTSKELAELLSKYSDLETKHADLKENYASNKTKLANLKAKNNELESNLLDKTAELADVNSKLAESESELSTRTDELQEAQENNRSLSVTVEALELDKEELNADIVKCNKSIKKKTTEIEALQKRNAQVEAFLAPIKTEAQSFRDIHTELTKTFSTLLKDMNMQEKNIANVLSALVSKGVEKDKEIKRLSDLHENDVSKLKASLEQQTALFKKKLETLGAKLKETESKNNVLENQSAKLKTTLDEKTKRIQDQAETLKKLSESLDILETKITDEENQKAQLLAKLESTENELQLTKQEFSSSISRYSEDISILRKEHTSKINALETIFKTEQEKSSELFANLSSRNQQLDHIRTQLNCLTEIQCHKIFGNDADFISNAFKAINEQFEKNQDAAAAIEKGYIDRIKKLFDSHQLLEAELTDVKQRFTQSNKALVQSNDALKSSSAQIDDLKAEAELKKTKIETLTSEVSALKQESALYKEELKSASVIIEDAIKAAETKQIELSEVQKQTHETIEELERTIAELESQLEDHKDKLLVAQANSNKNQAVIAQLLGDAQKTNNEFTELKISFKSVSNLLSDTEERCRNDSMLREEMQSKFAELTEQLSIEKEKVELLTSESKAIKESNERIAEWDSKLKIELNEQKHLTILEGIRAEELKIDIQILLEEQTKLRDMNDYLKAEVNRLRLLETNSMHLDHIRHLLIDQREYHTAAHLKLDSIMSAIPKDSEEAVKRPFEEIINALQEKLGKTDRDLDQLQEQHIFLLEQYKNEQSVNEKAAQTHKNVVSALENNSVKLTERIQDLVNEIGQIKNSGNFGESKKIESAPASDCINDKSFVRQLEKQISQYENQLQQYQYELGKLKDPSNKSDNDEITELKQQIMYREKIVASFIVGACKAKKQELDEQKQNIKNENI